MHTRTLKQTIYEVGLERRLSDFVAINERLGLLFCNTFLVYYAFLINTTEYCQDEIPCQVDDRPGKSLCVCAYS